MKRFMRLVLIQAIILVTVVCMAPFTMISATSNTYDLDELGLQVTIPDGYSVITRDTPDDDPVFDELIISRSEFIEMMENKNCFLYGHSKTFDESISIFMIENNDVPDFNTVSDRMMSSLASTLENQLAKTGYTYSKYDIYQHSQAKFIRVYYTDKNETVHYLQYYTTYGGKSINVNFASYEGNISSRHEEKMQKIVDSIKFDKDPPVVDQGEDVSAKNNNVVDEALRRFGMRFVTTAIIVSVYFLIKHMVGRKSRNNKKNKSDHDKANHTIPVSEPSENTKPMMICPKCGKSLPADSEYCYMCGTIFKKENEE